MSGYNQKKKGEKGCGAACEASAYNDKKRVAGIRGDADVCVFKFERMELNMARDGASKQIALGHVDIAADDA